MKIDGNKAFELLNEIGFVRVSGSEEEKKAAHILKSEVEKMGVDVEIESFELTDAKIEVSKLEVLEPYQKEYTVMTYKCCENTSDEGVEAEFYYAQDLNDVDLYNSKGKIVLVNGYLRLGAFQKLLKAGVKGIITMSGEMLDKLDETDLFTRTIRSTLREFGNMPAVNMRISDAFEMVQKNASKVRLTTKNTMETVVSQNVIATIKGTEYPDEIVSFGAHYDSVEFSTGVYDNGAGSVINMEILRHFASNPAKRTIQVMWYGSEEVGLEGSKAYIKAHSDELKNHVCMINVDVAGSVLGSDVARLISEKSAVDHMDYFMKAHGYSMGVKQDIYSSDCIPFAKAGIPAINFMRFACSGGAYIHCRYDIMKYLSAESLEKSGTMILNYVDEIINSIVFPIPRSIPKEMEDKVDDYLFVKELAKLKEEKK